MQTPPPDELLPVLVADLADDDARSILDEAAQVRGRVWVPLETAPISALAHILEVHTPGFPEPALYIAEALGPPTDDGFPLRIQPYNVAGAARSPSRESRGASGEGVLRGRRSATSMNLSESHTKDLSHVGPLPTEEDAQIGRALAGGKLLIEALIGRGGVGAVYKARHRELMMPVAVKVLHESFQADLDFARRFYAEALAASRLDHPNITRVIDFGQEPDGQLYFAMEYLDGVELRTVLERERKLRGDRIAAIMMQVCAGLSHAHARGVVHRDIKPENLVLVPGQDDDGTAVEVVKVCDFGIAIHRAIPTANEDGVVSGTPEYMSPEQCRSDELDARSDVYACGVVLYELATGQVPFIAERPVQILNKHQYTPPLPPSKIDPDVDPLLEAIILKALAKDASARQQSMRELRAELRELLDPIMVAAAPIPPSMREIPTPEEFRPITRKQLPTLPDDSDSERAIPVARKATPAHAAAPAWLERGPVYANAPQSERTGPVTPPQGGSQEIDSLAQNTIGWSQRLANTSDEATFAQAAQKLEPALRALAARGDVSALWTVSSTMSGIAQESRAAVGTRAFSAMKLLRVFDDPAVLVQIGEQALVGSQDARDKARRLLVHAGVAGAYGLYGARVKLAQVTQMRPLFVSVLKDFGPKAWPVVRASLEKIASTQSPNSATLDLAEDLLLCVQVIGDESAGHVVLKYLRWPQSGVCRAATAAIVKLWGERAKPLLVAMVQSKDDVVRVAGIAGLRQLAAIDEHLVPRLHAILTRRVPAGEDVRAAAAVALAHASATARQPAVSLLAQLLTPPRDVLPSDARPDARAGVPASGLTKQDAVVVALARSLLTLGGKPYRGLIAERAERSPEPLRGQLRGLLVQ